MRGIVQARCFVATEFLVTIDLRREWLMGHLENVWVALRSTLVMRPNEA
jgi:hypothetical protein